MTLIQPSSAAAEKVVVFFFITVKFKQSKERALEDYISVLVMLQYNYR